MRAAVITSPGSAPEAAEFPEPAGDEQLSLVGAGIHQIVRSRAAGTHYSSESTYPLVPGIDAVVRTSDGRLVYTAGPRTPWGTMAEHIATRLQIPLPDGTDPLAVAAGVNPGMSGWMPLVARREAVGSLDTVLIVGATGMSGGMAVQAALAMGAERVVATGRNPHALARLAGFGATTVPLDTVPDALAHELGQPEHLLVLDYVWGAPAEATFAALERHGMDDDPTDISYVQIGALAGATAAIPASLLRSRNIHIAGSGGGGTPFQTILEQIPHIIQAIADGTMEAPYTAYPLSRVTEAWAHTGPTRAVVTPDAE
ncbi:MAG: zinc-binding alcohol dehydrogenase family protein [Microbacterium sp.]